jgi:FlaA1/EpsC-like NDP-sugar epimerase
MKNRSNFFYDNKPDYCINASAYTAVDLAEKEKEKAFAVNAEGVANLAQACAEFKTVLSMFLQIMFLMEKPIFLIQKMILPIQ